jgi:hypothetical protein
VPSLVLSAKLGNKFVPIPCSTKERRIALCMELANGRWIEVGYAIRHLDPQRSGHLRLGVLFLAP